MQTEAVSAFGAVRAEVAGERSLPRVHTDVFYQLIGCSGQVATPLAAVLVALTMTPDVCLELWLPRKRPLADAAAVLIRR